MSGQVTSVEVAMGKVSRDEASWEEASWGGGGFDGRIAIPPLLFALSLFQISWFHPLLIHSFLFLPLEFPFCFFSIVDKARI